ncbi:hypothetical protein KY362_06345 [Candidatus Woesearchaeota archaeon]|nr:hypothetical protein [Candidatus Woesearchaeota archaeon]
MGVKLTPEEMELFKAGKLDPNKIEEHRKINPVRSIDHNELDKVKQEIRDTNILYQQAIQKNKDLYEELAQSRKDKEVLRNKIAELRLQKKKLLGLVE